MDQLIAVWRKGCVLRALVNDLFQRQRLWGAFDRVPCATPKKHFSAGDSPRSQPFDPPPPTPVAPGSSLSERIATDRTRPGRPSARRLGGSAERPIGSGTHQNEVGQRTPPRARSTDDAPRSVVPPPVRVCRARRGTEQGTRSADLLRACLSAVPAPAATGTGHRYHAGCGSQRARERRFLEGGRGARRLPLPAWASTRRTTVSPTSAHGHRGTGRVIENAIRTHTPAGSRSGPRTW
jgi:hypothetical protein